jgi:hypothetical protein
MSIITPIIMPFANGRGDNQLPTITPSLTIANQVDGFPVNQAIDPSLTDWVPIEENQMNGILYFYTNLLFQLGKGSQFTFDSTLSTAINGYDTGAILYCESNNTYQRSLINNNTYDFVGNPQFINDGVHWSTVTPYPDITDNITTGEVTIGGRIQGATQKILTYATVDPGAIYYMNTRDGASELVGKTGDNTAAYIGCYNEPGNELRMEMSLKNIDNTENTGIISLRNNRPYVTGAIATLSSEAKSIATLGDIVATEYISSSYHLTTLVVKQSNNTKYVLCGGFVNFSTASLMTVNLADIGLSNVITNSTGPANSINTANVEVYANTNLNVGQNTYFSLNANGNLNGNVVFSISFFTS